MTTEMLVKPRKTKGNDKIIHYQLWDSDEKVWITLCGLRRRNDEIVRVHKSLINCVVCRDLYKG